MADTLLTWPQPSDSADLGSVLTRLFSAPAPGSGALGNVGYPPLRAPPSNMLPRGYAPMAAPAVAAAAAPVSAASPMTQMTATPPSNSPFGLTRYDVQGERRPITTMNLGSLFGR